MNIVNFKWRLDYDVFLRWVLKVLIAYCVVYLFFGGAGEFIRVIVTAVIVGSDVWTQHEVTVVPESDDKGDE